MTEKQIVIANQLVNYFTNDLHDSAAPSVIFLHGWRAEAKIWLPVIERLLLRQGAARNDEVIKVFALDLPGFGKSEMPKRPFTVGDYADVVKEFIEKLITPTLPPPSLQFGGQARGRSGERGTVLIGHSFGGRIAIKSSIDKSLSIDKLLLIDSGGFRDDSSRKRVIAGLAKILKPLVPQSIKSRLYQTIGAEDYMATPEMRPTFLNVINEDLTEDMKKIKIPTLIIWGEDDDITPIESGKRMNSLIPNSKFLILPRAGHFSFLDQPDEFVGQLTRFISPPRAGARQGEVIGPEF